MASVTCDHSFVSLASFFSSLQGANLKPLKSQAVKALLAQAPLSWDAEVLTSMLEWLGDGDEAYPVEYLGLVAASFEARALS